jgi:prepilin-type N-terminal cleavage/methylation domain-containing protein
MKKLVAVPNYGFTLVELVVAIVLGAIILIPTSVVVVEAMMKSVNPEYFTTASFLLEQELERVENLRFSEVANQGPTAYTGNFSTYSYQVSFYYVNPGALNTQVAGPTDYKRVTISIARLGLPSLSAVALKSNY